MPQIASTHVVGSDVDILDKLGRQRPIVFTSLWSEIGFCFAIFGSIFMTEYFVSGFNIILPELATQLNIPEATQTWPASVFSLVTGSFLLPLGRLSDIYGCYIVFNAGIAWSFIWCLIAGFSTNYRTLIVCRALAGLGAAAYLVGGLTLLGKTYRPGPRKNLVFALYGAVAPVGFYFGILFGGISSHFLTWRWYFWLGSIIVFVVTVAALVAIPRDYRDDRTGNDEMDWKGTATVVPGLLLVVYSITDSSSAPRGWSNPRIIVTMVLGVGFLAAAYVVETRFAKSPLIPGDLFAPTYMKRLMVALFLLYGGFGLFLFYSSFYIQSVMGISSLLTAAWYTPLAVGGLLIGTVGGFTLHRLPGQLLLLISGIGNLVSVLLFAIMPPDANYWAYVFPAMVCATIGIDITFTVSNIFITNNLPSHRQGLAGAFINSVLFLGIGFFQGVGDLVVQQTGFTELKRRYRTAFWVAVAISGAALGLYTLIKIPTAKSNLTIEERQQQAAESAHELPNPPCAKRNTTTESEG
ncbi:hypothetical protein G7Z17_g476 [Cylindrodendrum hubeiense]|uniref:Major facilitator superfamily (MFS) profile domain-containing protein n=1 Tax=Cylindrodendrum hubeiense TaxID=595255 RepID=A0A9P5LN44_9HYPO|nr:hypothetical protein G7Z17_g476 [Cylindrodendrum hubeiense]